MLSQGEVSMRSQIQSKLNMMQSGKLLEIERRKASIQVLYLMKKVVRAIDAKSKVNYSAFKDFFFQEQRRNLRALLDYMKNFAYVKDPSFIATFTDNAAKAQAVEIQQTYNKIVNTYTKIVEGMEYINKSYYSTLINILDTTIVDSSTLSMRDKERSQVLQMKKDLTDDMEALPNKIKYFYTLNYSITEMFDAQFVLMYVIKAIRILSYRFSFNMATNVFIQKYDSTVYDKKVNPPSLVNFMVIFLGFDLFFNAFILVLLALSGFLFKTDNNTFPVDGYLYKKLGFDYVTTTIAIMTIGILIGSVIKQKKYFRYKTEGERGIRAFEDIMKMSATVITLMPLFMVVS